MYKKLIIMTLLMLATASFWAQSKPRVMSFDNPGNRRILKNADGNYYYFRSLPEKSMRLNVGGIDKIELRSFGIEAIRKPQVVVIIDKKRNTFDLTLKSRLNGYYIYEPVSVSIPEGTQSIEVLCYDRGIYFRAFYAVAPNPKTPKTKVPNLAIAEHGGIMSMTHNSASSDYYTFTPSQPLKFILNNKCDAIIYLRVRLLNRSVPVFELYQDGNLIDTIEFSLKRTTKYKVHGINHLSVGKKVELPKNTSNSTFELRAQSDHLFLARPVLLKAK
ncbi:MAG: hypothetical protein Q8J62_07955 [Candidatus Cloacimonadaceae bacterium]|nr:hypothetical protein [Candidatus Cloacimonadaceae bacterium]